MATPPGSPFDEPAHYVKAIGVGQGQLYGQPVVPQSDLRALFKARAEELARLGSYIASPAGRWQARTTRRFRVRPALLHPGFGCTFGRPDVTGACLDEEVRARVRRDLVGTYTGTYQPYLYVPAGLAIRTADTPVTALRLGRAATFAVSLALLAAAVWLLWSPRAPGVSLLGLVVAVTPMVLYVSSVLSPSGPEIAAAVCFSAALLRLSRQGPQPCWLWWALGASGAVLVAARALGPGFALLALVGVGLLVGPGRFLRRVRAGGVNAVAAAIAILVAVAASAVWEFTYQPRPSPSATSVLDALGPSLSHFDSIGKEAIGVFGALDAPMPGAGYALWLTLFGGLTAAALAAGSPRDRASIIGLIAMAVVVTLVMSVVYREIGPLHGRYAMPFLVLVPLWEGDVLLRRRANLTRKTLGALVSGAFSLAAAVHVLGWWASGRRFAVGEGGAWLFFGEADWAPPLGWWTWLLVVAAAAAAYLTAAALTVGVRARASPARVQPDGRGRA